MTIIFGLLFAIGIPAVCAAIILRASPALSWNKAGLIACLAILTSILGWRLLLTGLRRIIITDHGLTVRPALRPSIHLPWNEIGRVTFSSSKGRFELVAGEKCIPVGVTTKNILTFARILADRLDTSVYQEALEGLTERVD